MQAMITEKHLVKLMTKDELLDLKRMLMINALVRFNLIPPIGSDAWNLRGVAYECMGIHFLPTPQFNDVNETLVMQLLGEASSARTPQDKLSLYGKLAEVTGYSLMQLACPVLHKEFYDKIPEFYLLDAHNYEPPLTTAVLSAALCLDLQRKLDDSASLSCLYALAILLERDDVFRRLVELGINEYNMPSNTKQLFLQFPSYDNSEQIVEPMTKDERLNLKRMLSINALVRFNLIPPMGSEAWNSKKVAYECMAVHLLPFEHYSEANEGLIMQLLGEASAARTPHAKLNLYRKLAGLTGFSLMQLACPILYQMASTLKGICSYALFNTHGQDPAIPSHLASTAADRAGFYDKIPEFYLLDADNYQPPWTTNVLSAVLCLDLQRKLDDSASLSCLFALAALLERKDVITRLSAFNINENKMPIKTKELFVQFASYDKNEQLSVASPQFL